ncbi:MAG TPA: DUF2125 domain-containing protein [Caulobacteraceae bacterium]|jgi:hypothetical protein|nr:DUF2125 domain-containing protein [Caulobacteraceae bacterium]
MSETNPKKRGGYVGLLAPFAVVLLALAAWTVWWLVVAHRVETESDAKVKELGKAGYTVVWRERHVSGWPFRTFVQFEDVRIDAPGGASLSAPEVAAEAETYALGKWVVAAPKGLIWTRGKSEGAVKIDAVAIRASLDHLDSFPGDIRFEMRRPVFTPQPGSQPFPLASAEYIDFNMLPKANDAGAGAFIVVVQGAKAQPASQLGSIIGDQPFLARWEGSLEHLDRAKASSWKKAVGAWTRADGDITDNHAEFVQGDAAVEASSPAMTVSSDGRLSGDVTLDLRRSGKVLDRAMTQSLGADNASGFAGSVLRGLASQSKVVVTFDGKDTRFAGQHLAGAPKIF